MQHRNPSQYSTNPQTGLPEFGWFKNLVSSVTNAVGLTSKDSSSPAAPAGTPAASSTAGTSSAPAGTPGASAPAAGPSASQGNLKPREWFDDPNAVDYLSRYTDVAADPLFSQNPYLHYTTYGKNEGKTWGGTSSAAAAQVAAAPAKSQAAGANTASNSTVSGAAATGQASGGTDSAGGGTTSGTPSYSTSQYMGANAIKQAAQAVSGPYDQQSEAKLDEAVMAAAKEEQVDGVKFVTPFSYVDEYGNLNSKEMETPFSDAASNARRGQWGSTVQV